MCKSLKHCHASSESQSLTQVDQLPSNNMRRFKKLSKVQGRKDTDSADKFFDRDSKKSGLRFTPKGPGKFRFQKKFKTLRLVQADSGVSSITIRNEDETICDSENDSTLICPPAPRLRARTLNLPTFCPREFSIMMRELRQSFEEIVAAPVRRRSAPITSCTNLWVNNYSNCIKNSWQVQCSFSAIIPSHTPHLDLA